MTDSTPINQGLLRIAEVVDSIVPDDPKASKAMKLHREMIIVGCMYDMPPIRPSFPELAAVLGAPHTTVMNHLARWQQQHWRDRYGWMLLAEGRIRREEKPLDAALR